MALALVLGGAIGASSALIVTAQPAVAAPVTTDIEPPPRRPDQQPQFPKVWIAPAMPSLPDALVAPIE
jgi:hypothetical protein